MVNIYEYSDFKLFLQEAYIERKSEWKHFSHRYIAQKGQFSSGFFTKLIQGKTKLTDKNIEPLAEVFGLFAEDRAYFKLMVKYQQSKLEEDRRFAYSLMIDLRERKSKLIEEDELAYLSQWFHPVLREVLCFAEVGFDAQRIAESCFPPITSDKVQASLDLMMRLGLIYQEGNSYYRQDRVVSAGNALGTEAIGDYMSTCLDHARKALFELPKPDRSISSVVVSLSDQGVSRVMDKLQQTRKEILDIASEDRGVHNVFQVNVQAFPRYKGSHEI